MTSSSGLILLLVFGGHTRIARHTFIRKICHLINVSLKPNLIYRGVFIDYQYVIVFVIVLKLNWNVIVGSLDLSYQGTPISHSAIEAPYYTFVLSVGPTDL